MIVCKLPEEYSVNLKNFVNNLDFVAIFDFIDIAFLISCLFFGMVFFIRKTKNKIKYEIAKEKLI
jgi:hypothetical protein